MESQFQMYDSYFQNLQPLNERVNQLERSYQNFHQLNDRMNQVELAVCQRQQMTQGATHIWVKRAVTYGGKEYKEECRYTGYGREGAMTAEAIFGHFFMGQQAGLTGEQDSGPPNALEYSRC